MDFFDTWLSVKPVHVVGTSYPKMLCDLASPQ
jgi:hypothetical protein